MKLILNVYTRKTIPTDSLTLPTTSSIVMSLDETITAVHDNAVGDLDEAKVHLRLLVETVTEQNRFIQDNNATRELISTLQRAETDRLRVDTISQENQLARDTVQQLQENHFNSKTSESLDGKYFTEAGNGDEKLGPNNCKLCSKSFSCKIAVSNHMSAIHDKKKPYKCESCFKTFGYLNNLSNHKCKINKIILSETL